MGYWKNYLIENDFVDRSRFEDVFVCSECIDDPGLRKFIRENAMEDRCDYCEEESTKPIGTSVADLGRHMIECLTEDYAYAVNNLGWDGREGGYQGANHWDTWDLLIDEIEISLPRDNGKLLADLCAVLGDETWCARNTYHLTRHQVLTISWDQFCQTVKHQTRFMFWREAVDDEEDGEDSLLSPVQLLGSLGVFCKAAGLVRSLSRGTRVFRARQEEGPGGWKRVQDLG